MTDDEPTGPLRTFGEELRAHRKRAGMSQAEVGAKLLISQSLETAIENSRRLPKRAVAEGSDTLFDTPGTFVRLWRLIMQRAYPLRYGPYAELEADATRIHMWEMRFIPGLLQTEDYARAVITASRDSEVIENDVAMRMARQEIFAKNNTPVVWFIIDESVLYRPYGGPEVMREQMGKLITMAEYPNTIVQVLPFAATDHPGGTGPFIIFEFDGEHPIAYAEGRGSGRLIEAPRDVRDYMTCYDLIRAAALSRSATLEMLKARLTNG